METTYAQGTFHGMPHDAKSKAQKVLDKHARMVKEKQPWINTYKLVGEYVMTRKQNFDREVGQGEILTGQIFDSTAGNCNMMMASSLLGALYPYGGNSFQIVAPDLMPDELKQRDDVKNWYMQVNNVMTSVMDNAKNGLRTSLIEYMTDQGAFGISGIAVFENEEDDLTPVQFTAVDCKKITIAEGPNGFVDTVYIETEMTIKQLIQEFKWANVSKRSRERYEKGEAEAIVKVLHAIEPRIDGAPYCFGTAGMPIASMHIEMDEKHELDESGFYDMPVFVSRFWKAMGEKYGRSPAMEAMSDILELNLFREASIVATEKMLDPPLAVNDPDILGGGTLNTSAGAVNVRKMGTQPSLQSNRPAVEQIITVSEMTSTYKRIEVLTTSVQQAFFIDRLTDLSSDQRMTLGEVQIRNELRGQSLSTIYDRQISELFTPLINRTFNILFNRKFFGIMPDSKAHHAAIAQSIEVPLVPDVIADYALAGKEIFKITYTSPAARIMQAEEMMGIEKTALFAGQLAQLNPGVLDNIDMDKMIRRYSELSGASPSTVVSMETMKKLRDAKQKQQQQMMEMQAAQTGAATAKDAGSAAKSMKEAQAA